MEIFGTELTEFDQLFFNGNTMLNGILQIVITDAYQPQIGDGFTLIVGNFISYNFSDIQILGPPKANPSPPTLSAIPCTWTWPPYPSLVRRSSLYWAVSPWQQHAAPLSQRIRPADEGPGLRRHVLK